MSFRDDDLRQYAEHGAPPLPPALCEIRVEHAGAWIWCGVYGTGAPVILLHGAFNQSGDWGHQVTALTDAGYRAIAIDNRGRGRSTLGDRPLSYALMADEVLAVMDALGVREAAMVGWSDGSIVALTLAMHRPERVRGVFAFGTVMHLDGLKPLEPDGLLPLVFERVKRDHAHWSPEAGRFAEIAEAVDRMTSTQPTYDDQALASLRVPVAIVAAEHDEFVTTEHTDHLVATIPGAERIDLPEVSHFALLQRPDAFNRAMLAFLRRLG